jgi:hypothetical protein
VLRDKVTELAKERGRVTDMIADMADEEGQNP